MSRTRNKLLTPNYQRTANTSIKNLVSAETNNSTTKINSLKTTKDFIDYTFLSHRNLFSSIENKFNPSNKEETNNYLNDISKTLDLNLDLLVNFLLEKMNTNKEDRNTKQILMDNLIKIKKLIIIKKEKREKLIKQKGKMLIDSQIDEELKRKIEETKDYYSDQIKYLEENTQTKNDYIKLFEKKLKEVEIYVQKKTREINQGPYVKYKKWLLNDFLEDNVKAQKKKYKHIEQIENIKIEIENIQNENLENKKLITNKKIIPLKNKNTHIINNDEKIKNYIDYYKNNIKIIYKRIEYIKKYYFNMQQILSSFNVNQFKSTINNINEHDNDNKNKVMKKRKYSDINKENVYNSIQTEIMLNRKNIINEKIRKFPSKGINDQEINSNTMINTNNYLNISKRLNSFLDFSAILNNNCIKNDYYNESQIEDLGIDNKNESINNMGNVSNYNMWEDISCIKNKP